jgi:hypothetical protein
VVKNFLCGLVLLGRNFLGGVLIADAVFWDLSSTRFLDDVLCGLFLLGRNFLGGVLIADAIFWDFSSTRFLDDVLLQVSENFVFVLFFTDVNEK